MSNTNEPVEQWWLSSWGPQSHSVRSESDVTTPKQQCHEVCENEQCHNTGKCLHMVSPNGKGLGEVAEPKC